MLIIEVNWAATHQIKLKNARWVWDLCGTPTIFIVHSIYLTLFPVDKLQ